MNGETVLALTVHAHVPLDPVQFLVSGDDGHGVPLPVDCTLTV